MVIEMPPRATGNLPLRFQGVWIECYITFLPLPSLCDLLAWGFKHF